MCRAGCKTHKQLLADHCKRHTDQSAVTLRLHCTSTRFHFIHQMSALTLTLTLTDTEITLLTLTLTLNDTESVIKRNKRRFSVVTHKHLVDTCNMMGSEIIT